MFRLLRSLALIAITVPIGGSVAYAQDQPPLSFTDQSTLSVDCGRLANGVEVEIRNDSSTAQKVHATLNQLRDSSGKFHSADDVCGGISLTLTTPGNLKAAKAKAPVTIAAGGSTTLVLKAISAPSKGTATYQGSLAAYSDSGRVGRRDVSIAVVKPAPDAVPLVENQSVTQHRFDLTDHWAVWHKFDWTDHWAVWVPVKLEPGQKPSLSKGQSVGALTGEGGTTPVTYDGRAKKLTDSTSLLQLHIKPIGAGTYTGKLDLTPNDKDTGALTLTLTSKHFILLAIACIVAGILLALIAQHLNGFTLARARLRNRVRNTTNTLEDARAELTKGAGSKKWGDFDIKDLVVLQRDLLRQIDDRTGQAIIQIDQKIVDDLNAKIDALETKIDVLRSVAADALELENALSLLNAKRPADLPRLRGSDANSTQPRMVEAAHVLLQGELLTADDLKARIARIPEMTTTVQDLTFTEAELAHFWRLRKELSSALATGDHRAAVEKMTTTLEGVRHGLWDAVDADELKAVKGELDDASQQIVALWPFLPSPAPPMLMDYVEKPFLLRSRPRSVSTEARVPLAPPAEVGAPTETVALVAPELSAADAKEQIERARNSQLLVIGVSFLVALLTGLSALYIGKAWGTTWDYVWAIAWGLATQTAILTIAGAIDGLGALGTFRHGLGAHAKS